MWIFHAFQVDSEQRYRIFCDYFRWKDFNFTIPSWGGCRSGKLEQKYKWKVNKKGSQKTLEKPACWLIWYWENMKKVIKYFMLVVVVSCWANLIWWIQNKRYITRGKLIFKQKITFPPIQTGWVEQSLSSPQYIWIWFV